MTNHAVTSLWVDDPAALADRPCESVYVTTPSLHAPSTSWWVDAGDDREAFRYRRQARADDMRRGKFGQLNTVLIKDGFAR